jgi:1-phosphofructokinase
VGGATLTFCSLHPTRDVVLGVRDLDLGNVLRAEAWFTYPGGKALNAARTAGMLGARSRALVLSPPAWRGLLREFLGRFRVGFVLLPVDAEGRVCVVLNEGRRETVINTDLQLRLSVASRARLATAVRRASRRPGFLVLAGSLPPSLGLSAVRSLLRLASSGEAKLAIDQSGRWLREAVRHRPWIIKPNLHEFHGLLGRRTRTFRELVAGCDSLRAAGVGRVLLSLGGKGALLVSPFGAWLASALPAPKGELSPIGCGDALFGAFLRTIAAGGAEPEALAWGVAAGTANLAHRGACLMTAAEIRPLVPKVRVRRA